MYEIGNGEHVSKLSYSSDKIGICIKSLDRVVLSQNKESIDICGDRRGAHCRVGCMADYKCSSQLDILNEGIRMIKLASKDAEPCEAVLLHDGKSITTLVYRIKHRSNEELNLLSSSSEFTAREMEIISILSKGISNDEIARNLSISNSTLRRHLNQIYKKLPSEMAQILSKRRSRLF